MYLGYPQIDWAGFLVEAEPDLFQQHYLEEWNALLVAHLPGWAQKNQTRVQALGATKYGRRRYVLSVWGESAQSVVNLPFRKWADELSRYDLKRRLYDIRPDTYERLCVALQFAETRRNVEAFKLPKRTKSDKRDSGGEGVRFGSRKSDIYTKLSRRGNEIPYFETTVQDDLLGGIVNDAFIALEGAPNDNRAWASLLEALEPVQARHIGAWLTCAGIDRPIDGLRHEDIPMPGKLRKMFQLELFAGDAPLPLPDDEPPAHDTAQQQRDG